MILEFFLAISAGIAAGTFTGLFPGIHINLVSAIIAGSIASLSFFSMESWVVFIVSMSITHTFLDFIPSIFLGAPEEDTFLSILPGHRMLKEGKGYEAIVITLYGSIFALVIILLLTPLFIIVLPHLTSLTRIIVPYILIFISLFIILRDRSIFKAFLIFTFSGTLGYFALNSSINEPLLPLLTGLFGIPSLLLSIRNKSKIPLQLIPPLRKITLPRKELASAILATFVAAPFCSFLPALGSGHAATIGSEVVPQKPKGFLFLVGAINTIVMGLSFVTAFAIGKTRTGSAAAIMDLTGKISVDLLTAILIVVVLSSGVSFILGIWIAKRFAELFNKVNYSALATGIFLLLVTLVLYFSGLKGTLVLALSTIVGLYCIIYDVRRINLMGCLLVSTILYYI